MTDSVTKNKNIFKELLYMQKYGELIRNLRNESGISRDVLANILLVPADKLDEIEKGTG